MFFSIVVSCVLLGGGIYWLWMPPSAERRMSNRRLRLFPQRYDRAVARVMEITMILMGSFWLFVPLVTG